VIIISNNEMSAKGRSLILIVLFLTIPEYFAQFHGKKDRSYKKPTAQQGRKYMKIVSACLAGIECRYDCKSKENIDIVEMVKNGQALPLCPEQLGGLPTPRVPAEAQGNSIVTNNGDDVTHEYLKGAQEGLKMAKLVNAKEALLKSKSPMCGSGQIYDGTFSGTLTQGDGVFTKLLKENGIKVKSID
jgi:uncharacterized protein YbbK (DUF523 family)